MTQLTKLDILVTDIVLVSALHDLLIQCFGPVILGHIAHI